MLMTAIETRTNGWIGATAACLLLLAAACARSFEQRGSGETHFLSACSAECGSDLSCLGGLCTRSCDDSDACSGLGDDVTCEAPSTDAGGVDGVCDRLCTRDRDCDGLGANLACADGRCRAAATVDSGVPAPQARCPEGCVAVDGYAEDPERGCVDRAQPGFVGCDCNPDAAFAHCGRRTSDGTLWVFNAAEVGADSGFAACTPEESDRVTNACDFAHCEVQPLSICTLEATCADRGCDNLEFDAQGCRRAPCTTDAECSDDERCVVLACVTSSWCTVANPGPDEGCGCGGPPVCLRGAACNPVVTVGPAGAWRSIELVDVNPFCQARCGGGECPECNDTRTVDASGAITIKPMGTGETRADMLSEEDRVTLSQVIDGPTLRAGLRDGFECEPVADAVVGLRLELSAETLSQQIGGCAHRAGHEVARLYQLITAY
jgi:hypothetical protein